MITLIMPINPDNYYGSSMNSYDLSIGDEVYVGPSLITTVETIKGIHQENNGYTVITDNFKLIVPYGARVNVKPLWSKV